MSKLLQLRGGTTAEHATFTGALREVTVDTTKDTLVIHDGATVGGFPLPRSDEDIRAAVEAATDSNVFTDADHSKLNAIEASATADQTDAEIRAAVEAATDSNVFTDADHTKLNGIEAAATADQTADEIRAAVEAATDSNVFTDADHTKLNGIEAAATADQTKADIDALNIDADLLDGQHGAYYAPIDAPALTGNPTAVTQTAGDNSTRIATTAYADTAAANLVAAAPATLDTLNELAAALGDDPNFATTVTNSIATKLPLAGGAMTGPITTNSTFDGRDVSVDGTKLDGIASGATNVTNNNQIANGAGYITSYVNTTYSAGAGLDLTSTTFSIQSDLRGEAWLIGRDTNDYISVNTTEIDFVLDGNTDMRLENDGDLHVDGNVIAYSTTISDERLKTDIVKIDGALDKIAQLNGYTFTYIADGKKSAGVIAQEVQKVLPSAIIESKLPLKMGDDDETEYMTVQYDQLMGLLVEAIKELKEEVAALKGK